MEDGFCISYEITDTGRVCSAGGTPDGASFQPIEVFAGGYSLPGSSHVENQDSCGIYFDEKAAKAACVCDGVGGSNHPALASDVARNAALKAAAGELECPYAAVGTSGVARECPYAAVGTSGVARECPYPAVKAAGGELERPLRAILCGHHATLKARELRREAGAANGPSAQAAAVVATWDSLPTLHVAAVGDCCAFLVRDGFVKPLLDGTGRRFPWSNELEAALGADMDVAPFVREAEHVLEPGDRIVLCSDGIWNLDEFEKVVLDVIQTSNNPESAVLDLVEKLVSLHLDEWYDDATAVVIYAEEAPL